jgi:hypothetical protein
MFGRLVPEGSRRVLALCAVAATFVLLPGCAVKTVQYADRQLEPYLKSLTKQPEYPLARTMTWKYHYTVDPGKSNQQVWFVADGKLLRSAKEIAGTQIYAAQPSTYSGKMAEVYTQQARDASRQGNHQRAQIYSGLSSVSAQTQIASERVATGLALGSAIQGLGAGLLDMTIINHGNGAAQYVAAPERGVIGAGAPEGTVLELFFRAVRRNGDDAKPGNLSMQWETLVTLKDADGTIWRSDAAFTYFHYFSFESQQKPVPAEFADPKYMEMVTNTLIPAHNRDFVPEENEYKKVLARNGAAEFGVTAMQAIGNIYDQIEMTKPKGRRSR